MVAIKAHFNGSVFVPDEPARLRPGERYVVLSEREFLELQRMAPASPAAEGEGPGSAKFREVVPMKVGGIPASELLIRDRR